MNSRTALFVLSAGIAFFISHLEPAFSADSSLYSSSVEVQSQSTFSRFKIALDESFKPEFRNTKDGFEIFVKGATLMDIGVPFGGEDDFNHHLAKVTDSRVEKINVKENETGLLIQGKYHFPSGPQALAHPQMEHFDFRQADHGKYVVDFWYRKGITKTEEARQKKLSEIEKRKVEQEMLRKRENERRIAREKRMLEAKNALQFCDVPYDRTNTVFLKFHPTHPIFNFSAYFPENIPDHRFQYREPKGQGEEADMVRLALKLSSENQHALVVKTIDFLFKEYPETRYRNEMRFLKANSFYRLGFEDRGREELVNLSKLARGTEVGLQASAFLAVQYYTKKEWLAALEAFNTIRRENPNHPLNWLFHYGVAESLYQIKQSDQAVTEFEWLAKNAAKPQIKAEAAFKKGDVYYDRNQYALAIGSYLSSIKSFESSLSQYPEVLMNLAESYFQLEEYGKAIAQFNRYLEFGRNRPTAWRASLRIAEIKALNQKQNPEVETAFTDTVNRFPMTPGAVIARLRLLPCGNHGGFDLGGAQRFLSSPEVKNFDGGDDLYATSFRELVSLTEIRTLLAFGEDTTAVEQGIVHLRENPTVEVRHLIEQGMSGGIKRLLEKQLNSGEGVNAIATYEKYGDYLPPAFQDPLVDELRLRLAKFASEKKLSTFALKLIEPYRQMNEAEHREILAAVEKNLSLQGSKEQDERNFIEAKTLWNSDEFSIQDAKQGETFLSRLDAIRENSTYGWERDFLKGLYLSEKHEDAKALELCRKIGPGMGQAISRLTSNQKAQVWFWIGELAQRANDSAQAVKAFHEARIAKQNAGDSDQVDIGFQHVKNVPSISYLYTTEGELLERQQKWKEAVALYTEAIENKVGGNHVLYAHARALLKVGGRESRTIASRSLEKIKLSQDDDVWKTLAQKALDEIAKEGKTDDKRKQ